MSCYLVYKRYILFKWKGLHANRRYPGVQKENLLPVSRSTRTPPQRITPFPRGFSKLFFSYLNFPLNCLERRRSTRRFLICIFSLNLICTCGIILNESDVINPCHSSIYWEIKSNSTSFLFYFIQVEIYKNYGCQDEDSRLICKWQRV